MKITAKNADVVILEMNTYGFKNPSQSWVFLGEGFSPQEVGDYVKNTLVLNIMHQNDFAQKGKSNTDLVQRILMILQKKDAQDAIVFYQIT